MCQSGLVSVMVYVKVRWFTKSLESHTMTPYAAPLDDMKFVLAALLNKADGPNWDGDMMEAILTEADKVASEVLAPLNWQGNQLKSVHNPADHSVKTPEGFAHAHKTLVEGGWHSLPCDPEYGGQGLPKVVSAAVNEMWQAANMAYALCPLLTQGLIDALEQAGSPELKQTYLPKLISGEWTGTMNLTEPQAGTDLAAIRTMAKPQDDGTYLVSGQKIYITYGEHDMADNIIHLVLARTPDAPEGHKGLSLFVVPKFMVLEDGSLGERNDVHCVSIEHKLGILGSPTAVLQYGDKGGATGYLVGGLHQGLNTMFIMMNRARFDVGLQGLGISDRAFQQALSYAQTRVQGTPIDESKGATIIAHPDVKRLLLSMKSQVEAMRALSLVCADAMDQAEAHGDQQAKARAELLVPIVKGWNTELSVEIASTGVQIHGGMGFIEETGAAQFYRDARILPIYEGTTAIQSNDLVFRKTIRDQGQQVQALIADIKADLEAAKSSGDALSQELAALAEPSVEDGLKVIDYVVSQANQPAVAASAGVNYLMMLGYLAGGWMMIKSAAKLSESNADYSPEFVAAKRATARFYVTQILPQTASLARSILIGSAAVAETHHDLI